MDRANGYEEHAEAFIRCRRHPHIGQSVAREWARTFRPGATVLELGCGDGLISEVLADAGLTLYAVDASPTLLRAFAERFPAAEFECAADCIFKDLGCADERRQIFVYCATTGVRLGG